MNRHFKRGLRTGATVVGAAAGLMVLGYTGQSTDGFVHVNFNGPLGLFGRDAVEKVDTDVMAIGDGPSDANTLAALLKATAPGTKPGQPYQTTFEAGTPPNSNQLNVFPTVQSPTGATGGPVAQPSPQAGATPVVDAQGKVDCTGAVSCLLDPKTNVTTVTYSDGTMAMVQRINGMTLVAYQNGTGKAQSQPKPLTTPTPLPLAAVPAKPGPSPLASVSIPAAPATASDAPAVDSVPVVNPGPAATDQPSSTIPDITASTARLRVTVSQPPQDYSPSRPSAPGAASTPGSSSSAVSGALDAVREAVDSVVGAVGKVVGKAVNPGASNGSKRASNNQN